MKKRTWSVIWGCVVLQLLLPPDLAARPRPPLPPLPEFAPVLYRAAFDEAYFAGNRHTNQVRTAYGNLMESWSGFALVRSGSLASAFAVPAMDGAGNTNAACVEGAVRFWFRPYWSSGMGPGTDGRLVEMSTLSGQNATVAWSLAVSPDGSTISLVGLSGNSYGELLKADISWEAGQWHLLAFNYGPKGSALFIDGQLVTDGDAVPSVAPGNAVAVVGSTLGGSDAAEGEFDEVVFFGCPLTAGAVGFCHQIYGPTAALGAISVEEDAASKEAAGKRALEQEGAGMMLMSFGMQSSTNCVTNGPVYITNILAMLTTNQGTLVQFDIVGGTNGLLYEVFTTTNLLGTNITNSLWSCIATGQTCTTYCFTNEPDAHAFYVLGTPLDSDGDGLTDAYERLTSKTDPNASDTDNDWMPDGWEVLHGLDPLLNDASDDFDGDGMTNYQEYQAGTNPMSTMVIAWGNNSYGQCNVPVGLRDVVTVAAGSNFSLALRADGGVVAWGYGDYGQTNVPVGLTNVAAISANWWDALALSNGVPIRWGGLTNMPPASATNLAAISMGYSHALGLRSNGTVIPWGLESFRTTNLPVSLTNIIAVAAAHDHGVALRSNGQVVNWGPDLCLLGGTFWCVTNVPSDLTNAKAISAAYFHSLALRSNGTVEAWGSNQYGETNTPSGLSNVMAVAAGFGHSLVLKSNRTTSIWGKFAADQAAYVPNGLTNVVSIASGASHCLAIVGGRLTPFITLQPQLQCALPGGTATFTAAAVGAATVHYQWQFNGSNITGATNAALTLANVQTQDEGDYRAVISNGAGSTNTQSAALILGGPPLIALSTQPSEWRLRYGESLPLMAKATNASICPLPINYYWRLNDGPLLTSTVSTNYTIPFASATNEGTYSVFITNWVSYTNASWNVKVVGEGSPIWWGSGNTSTQSWDGIAGMHDAIALAAGVGHGLALRENSTVLAWGTNDFGQTNIPSGLSNVIALAAGDAHSLALKENGAVVAWGRNDLGQTNVPAIVTNAIAISAGGHQSAAVLKDGTVVQWGFTNAAIPTTASNVTALASGTNFHTALLGNGTVVNWGDNTYNQAPIIPAFDLSNAVAVAAGGAHALALRADGSVISWGAMAMQGIGSITNGIAIAAGYAHSVEKWTPKFRPPLKLVFSRSAHCGKEQIDETKTQAIQ